MIEPIRIPKRKSWLNGLSLEGKVPEDFPDAMLWQY